jgi:5-hydroxyisourate hydrolase-like protein (transthyretin family)
MEPGARADEPAESVAVQVTQLSDTEWKVLTALKREFTPQELAEDLWAGRAREAGLGTEEFHAIAEALNRRKVIGRFSTFLEHVKPLASGERVTKFNALFHWAVPPGLEEAAGIEVGRHFIMTHAYWREGGPEFRNVNIMGVAHGTDKAMVLAHIGLGLLVIGAVSDHHGRQIATKPMMVGDSLTLGPATLSFKALDRIEASNFDAQRAQFVITKAGNQICQTQAQRRFFQHSSEIIGKVGLCFMPFSDYYVIMGDPIILSDEQPRFQVRFLYNPMIRLIFLGIFFMVSAGLIAGLGARLRPKPTP